MLRRALVWLSVLALVSGCSSSPAEDLDSAADDSALTGEAGVSGSLAAGTRLTTTANVNFRSAPQIASNVQRVLRRGSAVVAVGGEAQNGFYAVSYQGTQGFVSARYLARASGDGNGATASGFRVTYIGDSHSDFEGSGGTFGILGFRVAQRLESQGAALALFAASSSAPNWWFDDTPEQAATWGYTQTVSSPARRTCTRGAKMGTCVPKLGAILSERPSLFVIEQGSNLIGRSKADITNQVRSMIAAIDDKVDACLWVGAPNARTSQYPAGDQDAVWQAIAANAAPRCYVYDSRVLPRFDGDGKPVLDAEGNLVMDVPLAYDEPHGDGMHLGATNAARWAQGVGAMIDWVRSRQH